MWRQHEGWLHCQPSAAFVRGSKQVQTWGGKKKLLSVLQRRKKIICMKKNPQETDLWPKKKKKKFCVRDVFLRAKTGGTLSVVLLWQVDFRQRSLRLDSCRGWRKLSQATQMFAAFSFRGRGFFASHFVLSQEWNFYIDAYFYFFIFFALEIGLNL